MKDGQISNVSPARCLVTLEVITAGMYLPKKRPWKSWEQVAKETHLEVPVNGVLWQASDRLSVIFEAVTFGLPEEYGDSLQRRFDKEGWVIHFTTAYADRRALQSSLAFRPDVVMVIDTNALAWGSRGITLDEVSRG